MTTMIRALLLFCCSWCLSASMLAQREDFGVFYEFNVEKSISKRLDVEFASSLRTINNAGSIDQFYLEGGLQYQPLKYISLSGHYRYIRKPEYNGYFPSHRLYSDIKTWFSYKKLKFSLRERLQYQKNTYVEEVEDLLPVYYSRIKAEIGYNLPHLPIKVIVYSEWFLPLSGASNVIVDQKRLSVGISYKIYKKQDIELAYIHKRDFDKTVKDLNILSLGYSIKI